MKISMYIEALEIFVVFNQKKGNFLTKKVSAEAPAGKITVFLHGVRVIFRY